MSVCWIYFDMGVSLKWPLEELHVFVTSVLVSFCSPGNAWSKLNSPLESGPCDAQFHASDAV